MCCGGSRQTLVFSKKRKAISTHHIILGTAPIGGHHATVQASQLPAKPLWVEEGFRGSVPTRSDPALGHSPRPCPPWAPFLILLHVCNQLPSVSFSRL